MEDLVYQPGLIPTKLPLSTITSNETRTNGVGMTTTNHQGYPNEATQTIKTYLFGNA